MTTILEERKKQFNKAKEIANIVLKAIGPIRPTGNAEVDKEINGNLHRLAVVIDMLIDQAEGGQ